MPLEQRKRDKFTFQLFHYLRSRWAIHSDLIDRRPPGQKDDLVYICLFVRNDFTVLYCYFRNVGQNQIDHIDQQSFEKTKKLTRL